MFSTLDRVRRPVRRSLRRVVARPARADGGRTTVASRGGAEPARAYHRRVEALVDDWPVWLVFAVLWAGAFARGTATYWVGRGVRAGGSRSRWARHLDSRRGARRAEGGCERVRRPGGDAGLPHRRRADRDQRLRGHAPDAAAPVPARRHRCGAGAVVARLHDRRVHRASTPGSATCRGGGRSWRSAVVVAIVRAVAAGSRSRRRPTTRRAPRTPVAPADRRAHAAPERCTARCGRGSHRGHWRPHAGTRLSWRPGPAACRKALDRAPR